MVQLHTSASQIDRSMESVNCEKACAGPFLALRVNSGKESSGHEGSCLGLPIFPEDSEWHSISLEDPSTPELEYCFHIIEGNQSHHHSRELLSMCGLSNCLGDDETETLVKYPGAFGSECSLISMDASNGPDGMREVRVSFHGLEDVNEKRSDGIKYEKVGKVASESGDRDDGCRPLLHQLRALFKEAKLSLSWFVSGDSKAVLVDAWSSLMERSWSVFFKSAVEPSKKRNGSPLRRSASTASLTVKLPVTDALKSNALLAQSKADALPLAHYRPTDGPSRKDGESKGTLSSPSVAERKSPGSCKKPPKPPKYPGRTASPDSGTLAAHRSVRKLKDRVSSKRKSRAAAASSAVTPLIAFLLTVGFGLLMVCQGVFVQPSVSFGKGIDKPFADTLSDVEASYLEANSVYDEFSNRIDAHSLVSNHEDAMTNQEAFSEAIHKSMNDLPWSRSSLASHVKAGSR